MQQIPDPAASVAIYSKPTADSGVKASNPRLQLALCHWLHSHAGILSWASDLALRVCGDRGAGPRRLLVANPESRSRDLQGRSEAAQESLVRASAGPLSEVHIPGQGRSQRSAAAYGASDSEIWRF